MRIDLHFLPQFLLALLVDAVADGKGGDSEEGGDHRRDQNGAAGCLGRVFGPFHDTLLWGRLGCAGGFQSQGFQEIALVHQGQRLRNGFPLHTGRPSFSKNFLSFSRSRKRRRETWPLFIPSLAAMRKTGSAR